MSKDKNIAQWLRDWLAGDTNSEQELRDAAREDTFLADAMEGYEQFPESDHGASLERLHGKLTERTQGAKRRSLVWYIPRIAVAASVLLVAVWLINENIKPEPADMALNTPAIEKSAENNKETMPKPFSAEVPEEAEEMLRRERTLTETPSAPAPPPAASSAGAGDKQAREKLEAKRKENRASKQRALKLQKYDESEAPIAATEPALAPAIQDEPLSYEAKEALTDVPIIEEDSNAGAPAPAEAEDAGIALERKEAAPSPAPSDPRKLRGLITDINGNPLIGASIIEPGTTNGTITDFDGQFDLNLEPNSQYIEIAYTGYQSTLLPVDEKSFIEVQLQEGLTLDEVVVVDFKVPLVEQDNTTSGQTVTSSKIKKERKKSNATTSKSNRAFRRFVKKNQRYPQAAKDNKIEGEVIIEFDINAKRRPENFKTVKSLGYGCDEEAIRLLKEGPDWEKGKKGRVRFEFK